MTTDAQHTIHMANESESALLALAEMETLVAKVLLQEALPAGTLSIVFVDDAYLTRLHEEYLQDNSVTDIITFDLSDGDELDSEIYISLPQAATQAKEFAVSLSREVARLLIHGILHLSGYDDHTAEERQQMQKMEEHYLRQLADLVERLAPN